MDPVCALIIDLLVDKFQIPADAVEVDATFGSLAVDSLVLVELAVILESRLGVVVADGELTTGQTIADAAELVRTKAAA
jgi:acyl carrier protein